MGADGLPMRFAAAAILLGFIVAVSAAALADFTRDARVTGFSADLSALEARASAIYQQGGARDISDPADNTGTRETVRFAVPDGIEIVVFGAMPPQNGSVPSQTNTRESNIIYYTTYQGVTRTMPSGARYGALPDLDKPIVLTPGTYELTIELVKDGSGTFIALY